MDIYGEFTKDRLRFKIGTEEIEVLISDNFYLPITGTDSFYMFRDNDTIDKLKDFIERHRIILGLYRRFRYWFLRNRVFVIIDKDVQDLVTIGQIYAYLELYLDGRVISIIKKPEAFDSLQLQDIMKLRHMSINRQGKILGDVIISKLS